MVGLTGGIATGKSTVSQILRDKGAIVIDADTIAREVVQQGEPAYEAIVRRFGPDVVAEDGTLNRARLGEIVFQDASARSELERITHPRIRERVLARLEEIRRDIPHAIVVYVSPLLYESEVNLPMLNEVVVVYAPRQLQKERLIKQRGMTAEEAERRIDSQMPTEGKARRADHVIDNSGDLAHTLQQVERLWEAWHSEGGPHRPR